MKRILSLFLGLFLVLTLFKPTKVSAASANISGPGSMTVGQSGSISINSNAPGGFFQGTLSVEGSSVKVNHSSQIYVSVGDQEISKSPSTSIGVTAVSPGTSVVNISIRGEDIDGNYFETSKSLTISVSKPAPAKPKPSNPTPSKPVPSTSNSSKPSTTQQKSPEQLKAEEEARKKAAEEERKAAEEKKKEELKKTPLFSSFDVMSLSDKRFEEVLETVATKFNVFEYEYQLPKNIDRFRLDFEKIDASVKLEYEKDHEFKGEEKVISVPVKATKGDVSQSFTIKIKRDDTPVVKQKVDDKEYVVFDDDALDGFMKNLGFKRETLKDGNNFYYEKDNVKLQLLVDEEFNGRWYLLNDKNEIVKPVTIMKLDGSLLVVSEAPEEYRKNTINDEKYEKRSIDYDKSYTEVHPKLNVETSYYSWKVDKGEVVFGMDSSGEEGFYFVSSLKDDVYQMEKAFVGFDKVDGKSQKIAMVSSFAFLGLMSTNLVSYYKKKKRV